MDIEDPHNELDSDDSDWQQRKCRDWNDLRWTLLIQSQFIDFVEEDKSDHPYPNATLEELFNLRDDPAYVAYISKIAVEDRDVAYYWAPSISADFIILENMAAPYDLLGATVQFPDYDDERDDHLVTMYVFEHASVDENKLEFLDRDGESFRIRWKAKCAVEWDEEYGSDLDFTLDCWIKFCGILVAADNRDEADKLVKARLDLSKLPVVEKVEADEGSDLGVGTRPGFRYSI